jgi:L-ornithine Nalpha-acyltransferase
MKLAHRNNLTVRLAASPQDLRAAQRLRYMIFFEEMSALPDEKARKTRLDEDRFDAFCDHLLVVKEGESDDDGAEVKDGRLVGTYRLLRQEVAEANGGFYSAGEFNLFPLFQRHPNLKFLEVGRSCVAKGFRDRPVAELLWQGIWNYVRHHKLDVLLGCASLPGNDPDAIAEELTFLSHKAPAPTDWDVQALSDRKVEMRRRPIESINQKAVLRKIPTLVKGYLRLGCYIGDGAVIDQQFKTTDVLIVLPVSAIDPRYFNYYGAPTHLPTS